MHIIELKNVAYTLPGAQIPLLDNIELVVNQGEFVILRGANARGKSTLVDIILGIREASNNDADIKLFGCLPNSLEAKFSTGVVFQKELEIPSWTQVGKFIDLVEQHYPGSQRKVISILQEFDIFDSEFTRKRTNNATRSPFAGSQERILNLALALAGSPKLLILDEPITNTLTETNKKKCWQHVKTFWKDGGTVLLVYPIDEGGVISDGIKEELRNNGIHPSKIFTLQRVNVNDIDSPRTLILERNSEISIEGFQATEEIEVDLKSIGVFHWIALILKYARINGEKLLAQPISPILNFLFGITFVVAFSFFFNVLQDRIPVIFSYSGFWFLANICCFYLAVVSTTSIGTNIVLGRKEAQWTKFRQTLPVPPVVYLIGEVIPYLLIWSLLVFVLVIASFICLNLSFSFSLVILIALVSGLSLFLFLGLTIGYRLPLDAFSLASLGLPLLFALPLIAGILLKLAKIAFDKTPQSLTKLSVIVDYLTVYSPLYHWVQLALGSVQSREYDQRFWIHLTWLAWATGFCLLLSVKAYRRSCKLVIASIDKRQDT